MTAVRRIQHLTDQADVRVVPTPAAGVAVGCWTFSPDDAEALCARIMLARDEALRTARIRDGRVRLREVRRDGSVVAEVDAEVTARNRALLCVSLDGEALWFDLTSDAPAPGDGRRHRHLLDPGDMEVLLTLEEKR